MRDYLEFDGIDSRDFGIYVADTNQFDAPARSIESSAVPGLNGELTLDNGRYENIEKRYLCYVRSGDLKNRIAGFRAALSSRLGYKVLKDTFNPDEFYQARFVNGFEVQTSDRYRAGFEIVFDRKPQRFLNSGQDVITMTAGGTIFNPTQFDALPLIKVEGAGEESFSIGGNTMTISWYYPTIIDCETKDCYYEGVNRNDKVSGTFPVLKPGFNTVTISQYITSLEITPRWWTI